MLVSTRHIVWSWSILRYCFSRPRQNPGILTLAISDFGGKYESLAFNFNWAQQSELSLKGHANVWVYSIMQFKKLSIGS